MRPTNIIYCTTAFLVLLLTGCATTAPMSADRDPPTPQMDASALYTAGKAAMNNGNPQESIHHFNTLITQHPINEITLQGRLELAYAYHKDGQTNAAIATAERFIDQHPQHKNLDYAYYLRGLTSYEAAIARLNAGISTDIAITGAPYEAHMALEYLNELIDHFPNGKFSGDTQQRINDLNERVARYLVIAAEQQLDQGNLAKAGLLAKAVVEEHPQSSSLQKAAIITNQAYQLLGLNSDNQHNVTSRQMKTSLKTDVQPPAIAIPLASHVTSATAKMAEPATEIVEPATEVVEPVTEVVEPATAAAIIATIENDAVNTSDNTTPANEMATMATPEKLLVASDIINISKKLSRHRNTRWHSRSFTYRLYLGGHLNAEYSQEKELLTISKDNDSGALTCEYSTRHDGLTNIAEDKAPACNTLASKLQTYLENN